jgi:arylsulfatase A-like enzyme
MVGERRREYLYGEFYEDEKATRMVRSGPHKLIYYPVGNRTQLFDLQSDPDELHDVADEAAYAKVRTELTRVLIQKFREGDLEWLNGDKLVGLPAPERPGDPGPDRPLGSQRGIRFR